MSCQAKTAKGTQCTRKSRVGDFCTQHSKQAEPIKEAITITFGDVAENHVGMEKIGELLTTGFSIGELERFQEHFDNSEIVDLNPDGEYEDAKVLIVRDAVKKFTQVDQLEKELKDLQWDTKAKMRGKVVNKHARYNLCFSHFDQEPDYEDGKGRVVSFDKLPRLNEVKKALEDLTDIKLVAEGNRYYDISKTGIGFHGDSERRIVIALRLGASIPLVYQWFHRSEPVGQRFEIDLNHGDMYFMSDKAVGHDWKRSSIYTLRHAAGSSKYTST